MNKKLLFLLILVVISSFSVFAWSGETHKLLAEQDLLSQYPDCKSEIDEGAVYPDAVIKDFVLHHCALNEPDCSAKERSREETEKAMELSGCEKVFQLAVANHYLEDSQDVAHHFSLKSSDHSKFEDCEINM